MFEKLKQINSRPKPFEFYTARDLWTDKHTSKQMIQNHLNDNVELSSRNSRFIDKSVEWIASRFSIDSESTVVDFGCGPGLYTTRLARLDSRVTGIDFSKRSIQYARESAENERLSIDYVNQNYLEYATNERFHLAMMIYCDFCALSPKQREEMLNRFHTVLEPGGRLLLDVHSLKAFEKREELATYEFNQLNRFWSPDDYYGFLNILKYEDDKVMLDKYTIIEESRTRTVYNWLQYFSPEMIEAEFSRCGFTIVELFSDVCGNRLDSNSEELAIVAKKK